MGANQAGTSYTEEEAKQMLGKTLVRLNCHDNSDGNRLRVEHSNVRQISWINLDDWQFIFVGWKNRSGFR